MRGELRTTRPILAVRSIDDIRTIEARPYDKVVTARNLYDLLLATARHFGDRKALTVLRSPDPMDVGASFTHKELLGEVTRAANMFRSLGIAPENGVVAFLAPTLPELPVLLLGAQVAGVASTLNYLLSADAIADLLNAQGATVLVLASEAADKTCWSKARGIFEKVPTLRHILVIGEGANAEKRYERLSEILGKHSADALNFDPVADRHSICALFHTGGTTGRPKLVQITHGNQIHAAFGFAQVFSYCEDDIVIDGLPFFHVGGTMTVGLAPLVAGAHVIVPSPYALRPPEVIANYWAIVEHYAATIIGGVPTSLVGLANSWTPGKKTSQVRMAMTGGAVLPKAVGVRFETITGIKIFETYGMTETAAAIAFNPGRGEPMMGSVGFRAPYSETRIVSVDPDKIRICGPGESGLVQVRGPQVFPGYMDSAHNTGTLSEDGWLTTGDVGYLTAGERLVLTGREKDLIVRSGHNIDPAAIEDVANQFEGIQISAAVGMPDQYAGEVPVLFVVAHEGVEVDLAALSAYLETHIHEPPAKPRAVLRIDALPVTAVGKIFKPALRDKAIEEKVRREAANIFGPETELRIDVGSGAQKQTIVTIRVANAEAAQLLRLSETLAPLPQTYIVEADNV